jgi:hypothetical protein
MNEHSDGTEAAEPEGEPPKFNGPRKHPITIMIDSELYDLIEGKRTGRTPSGKIVKEPRSTFLYELIKAGLTEEFTRCTDCGEQVGKYCLKCQTKREHLPSYQP